MYCFTQGEHKEEVIFYVSAGDRKDMLIKIFCSSLDTKQPVQQPAADIGQTLAADAEANVYL